MTDIISTQKYNMESKPEWTFSSSIDKEYKVHVSFINHDIVHLDVEGYTTDGNRVEVWPLVSSLIQSRFNGEPYYLIHNYKKFKGGDSKARNFYIQWINNNIKNIKSVYFYNASPFHKILIKAGKLLSKKLERTYILNSLEQTIDHINNNNNYTGEVNNEIWEVNKQFISKLNRSYTIKKSWINSHSDSESRSDLFLINDNIFIRRYFGSFGDGSMPQIEASFDDTLVQLGMEKSNYHFYMDFENITDMSLGFRKDGLNWFIKSRKRIISSGFFNISPILKIQVKIARSLSPFSALIKKVHIVDDFEEIFPLIEKSEYKFSNNKNSLLHRYDNYSKQELLSELKKAHQKIDFIENERNEQITSIYSKLGRVTWDETYEFTEEEIDNRDNPYADINNAIILIQEDIKEILKKRDNLIQKAQASEKLKSSFLANMSHEIRTPMNSIIGFTDILLEKIEDEEQSRFISIVNNSAQHLLSIINDILDISKIQSGNFQLQYSVININELIQAVIDEQKVINDKPQLDIVFKNTGSQFLNCDKVRIKQVFINILSNAIKFTEKGVIEIAHSQKDNFIEFYVKDNGKGINSEAQKYIFERFRQVDDSMTREFEGTGLGLSITKSLIEIHNGKIWLESEVGKGATFYFTIPLVKKTD